MKTLDPWRGRFLGPLAKDCYFALGVPHRAETLAGVLRRPVWAVRYALERLVAHRLVVVARVGPKRARSAPLDLVWVRSDALGARSI